MKQKGGNIVKRPVLQLCRSIFLYCKVHQLFPNIHFSSKESIPKELLDAFKGSDPGKKGVIPAKDLWNILTKWGEKISPREGKTIFSES